MAPSTTTALSTPPFVLAPLADEQRKRHGRVAPHITKRQLLELAAKQEQQRIELLAEREEESGNTDAAKELRALVDAIAEIVREMDP